MKSKEEPLYHAASFFMLRAPLLPIESFYQFLNQNSLQDYLFNLFDANAVFRHAILIASKELYNGMMNRKVKGEKQREQLKSSLIKYFSRMTSRCTPFGLFSFVSLGKWDDDHPHFCFDQAKLQKNARPDMAWLIQVIDELVNLPELFASLPVMTNPLLTHTSGRIYLSYVRKKSIDEVKKSISIRSNVLLRAIIKFADTSISVEELQNKIFIEFPTFDKEKTTGVIKQLIEQQILVSSLYPSLLTISAFEDFLHKISMMKISPINYELLLKIRDQIDNYNKTSLEEGEEFLLKIHQSMEKLVKVPNYLQVDLGSQQELSLPYKLKDELVEITEGIWKLSTFSNPDQIYLKDYLGKFIEKYGTTRRIPLLELLDEDELGIPEQYQNIFLRKMHVKSGESKWEKWLKTQLNLSLFEKRKEIILTDAIIDRFFDEKTERTKAPLSFDLLCSINASSHEELRNGDFQIDLLYYSSQAGNFFGRFLHLLGPKAKCSLKDLYLAEEKVDPYCKFVEVSYFPLNSRSANVAIHESLRTLQLDLTNNGNSTVSINEIYVGASENGFYLSNQEGNCEWIFRSGNMLTLDISPIPIRFLRDISLARHGIFRGFSWNELDNTLYLPRVTYKKAILSAAQWLVDQQMLETDDKTPIPLIVEKLKLWMERWEMPRFLFLTEGDNKILIDRKSIDYLNEIAQKIKIGQSAKLVEALDQKQNFNWLRSSLGSHFNEIVIPFTKNPNYSPHKLSIPNHKPCSIPPSIRRKLVGSDWLYLKIYLTKDNQDHFILNVLKRFTQTLTEQSIIKQWFYVRYQDIEDGAHLRVRFQGEKKKIVNTLIPIFHDWSNTLFEDRFIKNIHLGNYEREIERYGGEKLIETFEEFFCYDTYTTTELLKLLYRKEEKRPNYVIAAISLIDLAKKFAPLLEPSQEYSIFTSKDRNELKGIREWKKTLFDATEKLMGDPTHLSEEWLPFYQIFKIRHKSISNLVESIKTLSETKELTNSIPSIYHSLIHMHCNRLLGIDSNLEKKARLYAHYALTENRKNIYCKRQI